MKIVLGVIVGLITIVIVLGLLAFVYIDYLAKIGVERGATYALGVNTTLEGADVGIFAGTFSMEGLNVANPEGFDSPHFLSLKTGETDVALNTLRSEIVALEVLSFDTINMNLEKKKGKSNYQIILDNLKKLESGEKPKDESGEGKKYIIKKLVIAGDSKAHVDLLGIGGDLAKVDIVLPELQLEDIGVGDRGGVKMSELVTIVLQTLFLTIIENGADLPGEFLGEMQNLVTQLPSLDKFGVNVQAMVDGKLQEVTGQIPDLGEITGQATEQIEGVTEQLEGVGDQVDEALKSLPGLGGGKTNK